jgi:dTDP-glucose 4,6-dehydratase
MKHIIIGGDGFVGQHLAANLAASGEDVVVADIVKSRHAHYDKVRFVHVDVTDAASFANLSVDPEDAVYNLSAKMLSPIMPRAKRREFFWPVNYQGVKHILHWMEDNGAKNLVHFSTDMVYGHTQKVPTTEDESCRPLGEYGMSKLASERLCEKWRAKGFNITLCRPRLIIGPGRLGILSKLFKLVDLNLPVPMIGNGRNPYQFISVYDCASVCVAAWKAGFPNGVYNLGSDNPPPVRELLGRLIKDAGSCSVPLPTPAPLVKMTLNTLDFINMPIMDPEQYLIADEECILSTEAGKKDMNWYPQYRDEDMLSAAYQEYRAGIEGRKTAAPKAKARAVTVMEK